MGGVIGGVVVGAGSMGGVIGGGVIGAGGSIGGGVIGGVAGALLLGFAVGAEGWAEAPTPYAPTTHATARQTKVRRMRDSWLTSNRSIFFRRVGIDVILFLHTLLRWV
jgi:hypothetical protein